MYPVGLLDEKFATTRYLVAKNYVRTPKQDIAEHHQYPGTYVFTVVSAVLIRTIALASVQPLRFCVNSDCLGVRRWEICKLP